MQNHGLIYFMHRFPDDLYMLKTFGETTLARWKHSLPTLRTSKKKIYRSKDGKTFKCSSCSKRFNAKTGTL